jgi:hypothetical protein
MVNLVPLVRLSPVIDEHVLPSFRTQASHGTDVLLGFDVGFRADSLYQIAVSPRQVRAVRGYSLNVTERRKQVL